MNTIIIDTNGLFAQAQFKLDILGELKELGFTEFCIPDCVIQELEHLREGGSPREREAAEVAVSLLQDCRIIEDAPLAVDCDDSIARKAKELNVAVFSLDRLLRRKLTTQGTPVVCLRGGKKLERIA